MEGRKREDEKERKEVERNGKGEIKKKRKKGEWRR